MSKTILVDEIATFITNHDIERALRNAGYNDTPENVKRVTEAYLTI